MTLIPDLERDLVEAADRRRSLRGRTRRAAALGAAAAAAAHDLVTFGSSDDDPSPKRAAGGEPSPAPGTLVELSSFRFRGVRYQLSGYRSRRGEACMRIQQTPPVPGALDDRPSITCSGGQRLRRRLRQERVLNVGGGGAGRLIVSGFTAAAVSQIKVVGTDRPARVELTRPWRWVDGVRIRAFVIVVVPPRGADISKPALRIRAVEAGR
jgi:hypothetical protein